MRSTALRRIVAALLIALGVTAATTKVYDFRDRDPGSAAIIDDFLQDYLSARAWREGSDPYEEVHALQQRYVPHYQHDFGSTVQRNPHPPLTFMILAPLTFLPYTAARGLWVGMMAATFAFTGWWFLCSVGASRSAAVVGGLGMLALPIVQRDLSVGQNNSLLLIAIVAAWKVARRHGGIAAGALVGLAGAVKFFPLFLVIAFARERQRRAVGSAIAVCALITSASFAVLGSAAFGQWLEASANNYERWRASPLNASLVGYPFRWLTENEWQDAAVHLPTFAWALAVILALACAAGAVVTPARVSGDLFWSAVPWMLLAWPLTWDHYAVLVLPPVALGVIRALARDEVPPSLFAVGAAVVAIGAVPRLSDGPSDVHMLGYGIALYGLIAIVLSDARGRHLLTRKKAPFIPEP